MSVSVAPSSAAAVANEFIELAASEGNVPPLDQMKLQKLLYYAHAWYLALNDKPLFEEDFEAWPWGPVVRDIYYQTKDFGRAPVTQFVWRLTPTPAGKIFVDVSFETPRVDDPELKAFLKQVWDTHKRYSGVQLSNSTHGATEPWGIIKSRVKTLEHKPTIPNELIAEVFKKKLENARTNNPAA